MKKLYFFLLFIFPIIFFNHSIAQEYIDVTVRLDDYWAELSNEIGGEEATWHTYFTIGGQTSSTKHVWDSEPGAEYSGGLWYNQSLYYFPVKKVLNNNDNLVIYLKGWEEDQVLFGDFDYDTYDANDENYSSGNESDLDISNNTRGGYVAACGGTVDVGSLNKYYKIETYIMWNYSLPINPSFTLDDVTNISFLLNFGSTNNYRVTDWDYQVSTTSNFSNIIAENTEVTADETISGALTPGTTYYVRIRGENERGSGSYTSYKTVTTSSGQTIWDGLAWNNGAPDASVDAIISGDYNSSTMIDCNDLTIDNDTELTIVINNSLTVNGNLTIDGTLSIESGGSLITMNNIFNNGTVNIDHSMTDGDWHFISSPIENSTAAIFMGDYLQYYDETLPENNYVDIEDENTDLLACQGFSWRNYNKSDFTFTGTPYTGNQAISTTADNAEGWNLIGNPYPSSIDWNMLDDTYGTVYIWTGTGTEFSTYNDGATTNGGARYIAPTQGFLITTSGPGTFAVNNSHRSHSGADGYVKSANDLHSYLKLAAYNGNYSDEVFIQFGDQYQEGFDQLHDGLKMNSMNPERATLYTINYDGKQSIDRRPKCEVIQMGFNCETNTSASIHLLENSDIEIIQLEDTKLNIYHKLNQGAYEFNWSTSDSEERFKLHLTATGTNDTETQEAQIYSVKGQVFVRLNEQDKFNEITIYDLAGRVVYKDVLTKQNLQNFEVEHLSGAYLVQLMGRTKTKVEKIVL